MQKLFLLFVFILTGCTTAGPFVTNISRHKDGTLTIEKYFWGGPVPGVT